MAASPQQQFPDLFLTNPTRVTYFYRDLFLTNLVLSTGVYVYLYLLPICVDTELGIQVFLSFGSGIPKYSRLASVYFMAKSTSFYQQKKKQGFLKQLHLPN